MSEQRKIRNSDAEKLCHKMGCCPYGPLVEYFPVAKPREERGCEVFGHICSVYFVGEDASEKEEGVKPDV